MIQTNVVRIDGQRSVYLPIMKQGGDTNTIAVVDGIKGALKNLVDVPRSLVPKVVFDQSEFVKTAIETLLHEGGMGLILTAVMILVFLGSMRATTAVLFSIPLSALAAFIALAMGGSSINSMVLGGLALAFSRLIDNSVVVLENIHRHLELGESPEVAAEKGGAEVAMAVLAATLTTVVVFFPVTFLYGVSKFLFTALALAVILAMFASYFVAMTVVPLYCSKFLKAHEPHEHEKRRRKSLGSRFNSGFNRAFANMLDRYEGLLRRGLKRPALVVASILGVFAASLAIYPAIGVAFFPRTDPGQFVINVKASTGTRVGVTEQEVKQVEELVRKVVPKQELGLIVSNIGIVPDFSAIYTPNSGQHTAFVQVSLKPDHRVGSYEYMRRVRARLESELPYLSAYLQS
jgi:multidrug efflux pump subunit AcrB